MRNERLVPIAIISLLAILFVFLVQSQERFTPQSAKLSEPLATTVDARPERRPSAYLTRIFYLFDISLSMNDGTLDCPLRRAIPRLSQAIDAFARDDDLPKPQLHRVGTIESVSLEENPLCEDVVVGASGLFTMSGGTEREDATKGCKDALSACRSTPYTDISGAVKYAALAIQGRNKGVRGIVIFSDLQEHLAAGEETALAELHGICIAAYYYVTGYYISKPNSYESAVLKGWRERFRSLGAKETMFKPARDFDPVELTQFIRDCSRK